MKEREMVAGNMDTTRAHTTAADLKLRLAEHIINQYAHSGTTEVQNILAETKVGAWRRSALWEKLRTVFSESGVRP